MVPRRFAMILSSCLAIAARDAHAVNIAAAYAASYSVVDLGTPAGVATRFGGLTLLPNDPNTLLIAGGANATGGKLFTIGVVRDLSHHITGFVGTAVQYATADNNDGGVAFGPGGVLFVTAFNTNKLLQYKPGSTAPDKTTDLTALGIASSVERSTSYRLGPRGPARRRS